MKKDLTEYYVHPQMGDGHLNKCKSCVRNYARQRDKALRSTPEGLIADRKRGREKYYRLYQHKPPNPEIRKKSMLEYKKRYPEKQKAKNMSNSIVPPDGTEKHHWSYCEEHWKDVIFLSNSDHNKLHRYMIYDQERMMYRTINGILLDTREAHEKYLNSIKILE